MILLAELILAEQTWFNTSEELWNYFENNTTQDTYAIYDPLGQTHIHSSNDHHSRLNLDGWMDGQTYRQQVRK